MQRAEEIKHEIALMENFGNKLIGALALGNKNSKNVSLVKEIYSDLFKEELEKIQNEKNKPQSIQQQIENLRTWKDTNSKSKK